MRVVWVHLLPCVPCLTCSGPSVTNPAASMVVITHSTWTSDYILPQQECGSFLRAGGFSLPFQATLWVLTSSCGFSDTPELPLDLTWHSTLMPPVPQATPLVPRQCVFSSEPRVSINAYVNPSSTVDTSSKVWCHVYFTVSCPTFQPRGL